MLLETNGPGGHITAIGRFFSIGKPSKGYRDAVDISIRSQDLASSTPLSESAATIQWRIVSNASGFRLLLIRPLAYQGTQVGTLVIEARENLLVDLDTVFTSVIPGDYIILSDANGLIYRSQGIAEEDVIRLMANASTEGYRHEKQDIIYVINSSELRFRIVALQSLEQTALNVYPGISVAVFGLMFLLMCVLITIPLYLSLSRRIRRLATHMTGTSSLTPASLAPVEGADEIAQLTEAYNDLLLRMEKMAQDTQTAQMLQQNAAYDALQAQIKPHFLYNTLETLRMMAEGNDDEEVADMIYLLGKHLRSTISPGSRSTTISQEMENVQSYLQLYILRMPNLSFTLRMDEDAGRIECPRYIVQPLVENVIKHGLKGCRAQALIDISARLDGQRLLVEVRDNGVGIPGEQLEKINERIREGMLDSDTATISSGLGLHNVHMRLKMFYGGDSSVTFVADGGEGIICRMTLDLGKTEQKGR